MKCLLGKEPTNPVTIDVDLSQSAAAGLPVEIAECTTCENTTFRVTGGFKCEYRVVYLRIKTLNYIAGRFAVRKKVRLIDNVAFVQRVVYLREGTADVDGIAIDSDSFDTTIDNTGGVERGKF